MRAVLNIYADCTSEKPSKQYVCLRLLTGVNKKIQDNAAALLKPENQSEEKQTELMINIIKAIFPTFQDEEIDYIDPAEWADFVNTINGESARVDKQALKN